jgi:hypothetical protein
MKFESDTEMDRLLRRQARRKLSSASSTAGSASAKNGDDEGQATRRANKAAHLDADEMNAFAEGNLPEASRSRYFAHLADCDDCRGLVTKLTLAANVPLETGERTTAVAASARHSWRDWLSAFFAPPVLRYAVPALALMAVIVVAFVATRPERQSDFVAQNEASKANAETAPLNQSSQSEQQAHTTTATSNTTPSPAVAAGAPQSADTNTKADSQPEALKNTVNQTAQRKDADEAGPDVKVLQDAPKPAEKPTGGFFRTQTRDNNEVVSVAKEQPPVTVAPAATKAPTADSSAVEEAEAKSEDADKKNKTSASLGRIAGGVVLDGAANESAQGERGRTQEGARRGSAATAARRSRPADNQSSREADGADAKDNRPSETRNAGGRQFRRQGGVWIDTAYSSSRATVNIPRGSEQYRALVADEPGIRAIADQLGGTVILVWKQRAYRIY